MQELPPIEVGKTVVRVMKRDVNEYTRREEIKKIHEGIVVKNLGTFVRVYNPAPLDKGGDVSQNTTEAFALNGRNIWAEVINCKKEALPIACELR